MNVRASRILTCIYCLETKASQEFKSAEHVIPRGFGKFDGQNPTLHSVCHACNQEFGNTLDKLLLRDTHEGSARFTTGLMPGTEYKHLGERSRMQFRVDLAGPLEGAHAYLEAKTRNLLPLPQVGVLKKDGGYHYLPLKELPHWNEVNKENYALDSERTFHLLGATADEATAIIRQKGWTFVNHGPSSIDRPTGVPVEVTRPIYRAYVRSIAKIAFNYAAYVLGSGIESVRFDPARAFIRYDEGDEKAALAHSVTSEPFPGTPTEGSKRAHCHGLLIDRSGDGSCVAVKVTLFNQSTHTVELAVGPTGTWDFERQGHIFNLSSRPMRVISLGCRDD